MPRPADHPAARARQGGPAASPRGVLRRGLVGTMLALALLLAVLPAGMLDARQQKPGLENEADIFDRLLLGAVVSEVYTNCDRIEPRKLKATVFVLGTLKMAKDKGYTMDEIDAFRFDPVQQERLRQATYAFFDENGVDRDDPESYCRFGFAEMKKNSRIGRFLKRK